ncbi:MAG: potassium channel family protein [Solirubrobacterales bacterium]
MPTYRFGLVLALILVSVGFGLAAPEGDWARLVIVVLQAATLVAAVAASETHRWVLRGAVLAAVVLAAGAAAALLGTDEFGSDSSRLISLILVAMAPPAISYGLVRDFQQERTVTVHTMFGVLCLYLLLGLLFSAALETIQSVGGDSMLKPTGTEPADFLYFSYSTLTTTGFGDVVARTDVARSLTVVEALVGQIYLVTVVALIVGNLGPRTARS